MSKFLHVLALFGLALVLASCKRDNVRHGDPAALARLDAAITRYAGNPGDINGAIGVIALVEDGLQKISWTGARGSLGDASGASPTPGTPFRIASITKTFVAAAVFKLIERGNFEVDAPIGPLLSDPIRAALIAGGADPGKITVRQLLGHRSGLFDYAATPEYVAAVIESPRRRWSRLEQLQLALQLNPPGTPGSRYAYADTNYILLGEILERATGQSLAGALRNTLDFGRLGLTSTWLESLEPAPAGLPVRLHQRIVGVDTFDADPSFDLWGGGGLVSTVGDLGRFFRALFSGEIVSKGTLERMSSEFSGGGFGEQAYALGLMAFYIGDTQCFGHEGVALELAAYCPSIQLTLVATQVNNDHPGMTIDRPGFIQELAVAVGTSVRFGDFAATMRRARCSPEFAAATVPVVCGMFKAGDTGPAGAPQPVELAVAIAQHPTVTASIEPLLLLGGGPGEPLFTDAPALLADPALADALVKGQDVVFVEQRGVGASRPVLVCPGGIIDAAGAAACARELQQAGLDLAGYSSIASAADLEGLRVAIGAARWNLLGFSYGTKLALTMYRERPATIASLVLDGVLPAEQNPQDDAPQFAQVIDDLLRQCAQDARCAVAHPDLHARFFSALRELDATPALVNGLPLSGAVLVNALSGFQASPQLVPYLPAVMDAIAGRDAAFFDALTRGSVGAVNGGEPSVFSDAMYFSVNCNEEFPFADRATLQDQFSGDDPVRSAIAAASLNNAAVCDVWPSGRAPDRDNLPVDVAVPVLAFNGEFDLQTPPVAARNAAAHWQQAQLVEFRGVGHAVTKQVPACAVALVISFERSGSAGAIDDSCARQLPAVQWRESLDAEFYQLFAGG